METEANISITQKELPSGNCQVKFYIEDERKPMYGYLLTNEPKPVGEIISEIQERIIRRKMMTSNNPLSLQNPVKEDHNFYLYSA
ncbi:hypothetical protein A33Q_2971 [Indibacter alkaliphilus LW1]|uniref:Uncharacterized protein n=1 Tax=Indibacter alkaliphilus (strain CCUG 57479 / KCTC 22604 / LW1) TaxID=1189612 RepID=S2D9R3_INDAL|nr:hypothetical protein [Indibacter alkaliphilus]EOZ95609.1 hypothetical protein A33Q_2971 [Indibacter alkaliphilus LW1]